MAADIKVPSPPKGFTLDVPDPPKGFVLDAPSSSGGPVKERDFYPDDPATSIQSETLTAQEEAQQKFNEYIDRTPVVEKKSIIPQAVGGTVGSLAFERAASQATQGLPPNLKYLGLPIRVAAGVTGAAFGGAGGKGFQQLATGDIKNLKQIYGDQGVAATSEAMNEVGGRLAGGLFGRALSGGFARGSQMTHRTTNRLSNKLTEAGKRTRGRDISPASRAALKRGEAGLTEGQKGSRGLAFVENFLKSSWVGGGKLKRVVKDLNPEALKTLKNELVEQYWKDAGGKLSKDELAEEVSSVLNKNMDSFHQRFTTSLLNDKKPLDPITIGKLTDSARKAVITQNKKVVSKAYANVDELAKQSGIVSQDAGDIVPLNNAFQVAQKLKNKWTDLGESALRKEMLELADVVLTGPQKTFVENADKGIRSQLLSQSRKLDQVGSRTKNPTLDSAIRSITDAVDTDLKVALNRFDPAIHDALEEARKLARKNIEFEESPFVKKIHSLIDGAEPEKLVNHIFKDGSPKSIDLAQRAIGKETVSELADTWLNKQVTESMGNTKSIGNELKRRLDKMGRSSLDSVFGANKTDDIYAIAKSFEREGSGFLERRTTKAVLNLADSNPSIIANKIIQKDNTKNLLKWKEQLGPARYKKVLASWVDDAVNSGTLNKKLNDLGIKMQKHTFVDAKHLKDIRDIARIEESLGLTSDGTSVLAKILEAGAIGGLIAGPAKAIKGGAATILGGLPIAGALLTHKKSAHWISKGIKNPRRFQAYLSKATAELARHGKANIAEQNRKGGIPWGGPEHLRLRKTEKKFGGKL